LANNRIAEPISHVGMDVTVLEAQRSRASRGSGAWNRLSTLAAVNGVAIPRQMARSDFTNPIVIALTLHGAHETPDLGVRPRSLRRRLVIAGVIGLVARATDPEAVAPR